MKKIKRTLICVLSLVCCLSFALGLIACKKGDENGDSKPLTKLYLLSAEYSLEVGASVEVKTRYDGEETITYTTSNSNVVSVDASGKMTGVSGGNAYVTASVEEQSVTCRVSVVDVEYTVSIGYGNINLVVGTEKSFTARLLRNGVEYDGNVTWSVSGGEAATFTPDKNKASFKSNVVGEYIVTATSDKASASCVIRVVNENAVRLSAPELTLTNCDTASWKEISGVAGYAVSVNGGEWIKTTDLAYAFSELSNGMKTGDKASISVKALAGDNFSLIDSYITGITVEHSFTIEELTEATCLVAGQAKYTCEICARNYTIDNYTEEHTFDNNVCTKCDSQRTPAFLYFYDETYDCYYVGGIMSTDYPVAYVSGYYDDGIHGKKVVEYISKSAFSGNASITHLILPENVTMIYGNAFMNMTALEYLYMGGVSTIKNYYRGHAEVPNYEGMTEEEKAAAKAEYEDKEKNIRTGFNQVLNCKSLNTLVINKSLVCDSQAFISSNPERHMTIYALEENGIISLNTTDMWNGEVYYYDETNTRCGSWHFAENGYDVEMSDYNHTYRGGYCKYCGQQDPKGLVYKYDMTDDCYYLAHSPDAKGETIVVLGSYTDGTNGVKPVKYLACIDEKGVFEGNTTVKKIILPDSIVCINGDAFNGCTALEEVVMLGVKTLYQGEANRDSSKDEFGKWYGCENPEAEIGLKSMYGMFKGYNFSGCVSLTTLVVADGFRALNSQKDNFRNEAVVMLIVNGTNKIVMGEDYGTLLPLYYSETPTTDCGYWYYNADEEMIKNSTAHDPNENMICKLCNQKVPLLVDEQGITYGYDETADVYYVAKNIELELETVVIPEKFDDGVHGEKTVKYVANSAFSGNAKIKKVILPESVIVVGNGAFHNCSSLTYLAMPGVKAVAYESHFAGYNQGYERVSPGKNTFLNSPITTLVVPTGFEVQGQQFTSESGRITRVYSLATKPSVWTGDRASNCVIRTEENGGFINTYEAPITSPIYYYSEEMPTNPKYTFWHYVDGEIVVWTEYGVGPLLTDAQGVTYGYDATFDCYYVDENIELMNEIVVIPEKFNDGIHGEKQVKYVADSAFYGNANLKKIILPESVEVIGKYAFNNCTSLTYVSMPGVTTVSMENNGPYGKGYENITIGGTGTFANAPIETLIVPEGFDVREPQFTNSTETIRVYSLATTPAEWTGDRASNCKIRSGKKFNSAFINVCDEGKVSPIYYYSSTQPSDTNYVYWHYVDGEIVVWGATE